MSEEESEASFIGFRRLPTLILLGLAAPLWIALRGWFHLRMLVFTLLGFASFVPAAFLASFVGTLLDLDQRDFWNAMIWPLRLSRHWPEIAVWPIVWIGLSLAYHLFTARGAMAPQPNGGGRLILHPNSGGERLVELLLQWALIGAGGYLLWIEPATLRELGFPLAPESMRLGYAVNAAAFAILSLQVFLNGGSYPGFVPGLGAPSGGRPNYRAFRFVSRLRVSGQRRSGLRAVFSRRPDELRKIASGD